MVLAVDLDRGDVVVLELTASHGLHVSDGLGLVAILAGVGLLLVACRDTGTRSAS